MYPLIRPLLFRMDPERAHGVTLDALRLHLEQLAYHQINVAKFSTPELDFES